MTASESSGTGNPNTGNPYVGPRTFGYADRDRYFGREREARDLLARVISARLMLFYAQSGAGKSSLVNARLIPALREEEGFSVLPVGRVAGELPDGVADVANIFVFNLISSLEQGATSPARLADLTLQEFLDHLVTEDGTTWRYDPTIPTEPDPTATGPTEIPSTQTVSDGWDASPRFALIIDQFEEIVTAHAERWEERADFFEQLDQALLANPNLWVVLTLRDDYVAALDPYAVLLHNRLRARFYMERMDKRAALDAVMQPAALAGRPFDPHAAQQLVEDLSRIRVVGQAETFPGQYVEPVQLQVVCYQLWEQLHETQLAPAGQPAAGNRARPQLITEADLAAAGNVDRALEEFYADTLSTVLTDPAVQATNVSERRLRAWFGRALITGTDLRNTVHRNEVTGLTAGLPNAVVDALRDRFLLRGELRGGGTWIELVHDSFVKPIQQSNRAWFQANHNPLTQPTQRWLEAGRLRKQLLDGSSLSSAMEFAARHPLELSDDETAFLHESRMRARERTVFAVVAAVVGLVLTALVVLFVHQRNIAQEQRVNAEGNESRYWSYLSTAWLTDDPVAAIHLSLSALPSDINPRSYVPEAEFALAQAVQISAERDFLELSAEPLTPDRVALRPGDPARTWVAIGGDALRVTTVTTAAISHTARFSATTTLVTTIQDRVAWSSDGALLLSIDTEPDHVNYRVWQFDAAGSSPAPTLQAQLRRGYSQCEAWRPTGHEIALCAGDEVRLWSPLEQGDAGPPITAMPGTVDGLRWSDDGAQLAVWDTGGALTLIEPQAAAQRAFGVRAHCGQAGADCEAVPIRDVAWAPGNRPGSLAVAYEDGRLGIWESGAPGVIQLVTADAGPLEDVTYVDDAHILTWGFTSAVRLWSVRGRLLREFRDGSSHDRVRGLQIAPDSRHVVAWYQDGTARRWALDPTEEPQSVELVGHEKPIAATAWHPSGRYLATAALDGTARVWDLQRVNRDGHAQAPATLRGHTNLDGLSALVDVIGVHWIDDRQLLTWGEDGSLRLWDPFPLPIEQSCTGGSDGGGAQRPYCRQTATEARAPGLVQWSEAETLYAAIDRSTRDRTTLCMTGETHVAAIDAASGAVQPRSINAQLLPNATGTGTLLPVRRDQGEPCGRNASYQVSILDLARDATEVFALPPFSATVNLHALAVYDDTRVATAQQDGLTVWQATDDGPAQAVWTMPLTGTTSALAWSEDGRQILTSGAMVQLNDAEDGQLLWSWEPSDDFAGFGRSPHPAALSGDGRYVAVAGSQALAILPIELSTADDDQEIAWHRIDAHDSDTIQGLAFLRGIDGDDADAMRSLLVSWSGDGNTKVWDWQRDAEILRLDGAGRVDLAAVAPDGANVATVYRDSEFAAQGVRIWRRWDPAALRAAGEAAARHRPLTPEQQALFNISPAGESGR